jgi:hypothetical protein
LDARRAETPRLLEIKEIRENRENRKTRKSTIIEKRAFYTKIFTSVAGGQGGEIFVQNARFRLWWILRYFYFLFFFRGGGVMSTNILPKFALRGKEVEYMLIVG